MHQDSFDNVLETSPNSSGIGFKPKNNFSSHLKLQKPVSQQNRYHLSIETKGSGPKLVPKTFYLSKTSKNEQNEDSYTLVAQKNKDPNSTNTAILPRTWGSPVSRQLRKITTPQTNPLDNFNSPVSKTNVLSGFESPPFSSFHNYGSAASHDQPYTSLSAMSKNSSQVLLNNRYIRANPHFSKFNRSITAVDKRANDKLSLSRESFFYPEQVEAIENIKRYKSKGPEINLSLLTKSKEIFCDTFYWLVFLVIKENKPEDIEIPEGKTFYLKLYTYGKSCPINVTIEGSSGTYDVFISRSREKPNMGNHDLHFRNNAFELDFSEYDDIKCIYFGIKASQKIRLTILCCYTFRSRIQKIQTPSIISSLTAIEVPKDQRPKNGIREPVYEFFNKNISREEMKDFEELIGNKNSVNNYLKKYSANKEGEKTKNVVIVTRKKLLDTK